MSTSKSHNILLSDHFKKKKINKPTSKYKWTIHNIQSYSSDASSFIFSRSPSTSHPPTIVIPPGTKCSAALLPQWCVAGNPPSPSWSASPPHLDDLVPSNQVWNTHVISCYITSMTWKMCVPNFCLFSGNQKFKVLKKFGFNWKSSTSEDLPLRCWLITTSVDCIRSIPNTLGSTCCTMTPSRAGVCCRWL